MSATPPRTLAWLNDAPAADALAALDGLYEHSPWVVERALAQRPFASLAQFEHALAREVRKAPREAQLALIRAHPELAGKAAVAGTLTAESTGEQARAGLNRCTPEEFAQVQRLNAAYRERFGWPFVMAVRGARGLGLPRTQIIATLERRLLGHPDVEFAECLRQIDRIAQIRLNDSFGFEPALGNAVWDWAEQLAAHSEPAWAARGELTVTYLSGAHRACAAQLQAWMRECGFDEVSLDAVGNVVGVYRGTDAHAPRLLTGSHYDTVRNAGKHDGRLGILVPMVGVRELRRAGRRLPFGIEVVGFAEEEGQRYKATFLGSSALTGHFDPAWLEQRDADGVSMRAAMHAAGLPGASPDPAGLPGASPDPAGLPGASPDPAGLPAMLEAIAACRRDATRYLGFVEVHIEQGPVLSELDLPLGVVTSINGSVRYLGEVIGVASHAGTTPMGHRRDAAAAVAELLLFAERRAAAQPDVVATVGVLNVPSGSINVVPGRCSFSLDLRATTNEARDACVRDVLAELAAICGRRGVGFTIEETMRADAAPSDPAWQRRWERAVASTGLPVHRLPSGAGHDAMKLHQAMPQAMLFVRGENAGISHNPLESTTADDMQLAVVAFMHLLDQLAEEAMSGESPPSANAPSGKPAAGRRSPT
ncbi:MAG TPA: 2-oxo-4-hydroxy-4-carboxy-5-ureidoimidazoline decarboxylase [Methylibium sp.]|uniref:2-oxo-4-hydroxy-4-carboxy-5-ureidoimidazoline decarboxylase n=1 Tax=Methylibium sp. TaxID=2067992 RepID=UPI002DBDB3BC|nr:2-oxo-4-hydroxy-4-carboxy-5-ureidoimidazoline decarboxylase [Methylibium sp.]HEU4460684.1 2-oxo-4-hydroxy-4-carboxy-5-ureidoimidazoline decarboxylase [Methylibium sp.]